MLKFLKTKKQIYKDGFNDGYECHKSYADRKIRKLKNKIRKQNKKIKDMEIILQSLSEIFLDARNYAIQLDKINKIKLFEATKEYQENKIIASNILQYCRSYEKQKPDAENKLRELKIG